MLTRIRSAGLLLPAVMSLIALAVLLALGTWQLQRRTWKEGLIARLGERAHAAPVDLAEVVSAQHRTHDIEYMHARVRGRFDHASERYLYATHEQFGPGWHVYTLLRPTAGGSPVLVNRGFVPVTMKEPATRAAGQVTGEVELTGLVRGSEQPGTFTPKNDPKANLWFWRDVPAMTASAEAAARGAEPQLAPPQRAGAAAYIFAIDADATPANPGGWPRGGTTIINLPNKHLEYALTWYGLAAALMAIFAGFAGGRLRQSPADGTGDASR